MKLLNYTFIVLWAAAPACSLAQTTEVQRESSPDAVVREHIAALNACDLPRLMAQFPEGVVFHLPDGVIVEGRSAVRKLFADFTKPYAEGGLCGLHFTIVHSSVVGGTVIGEWTSEAPFLKEAYRGSDAFVTRDGLMAGQVSTFRRADLMTGSK